MKYRIVMTPNLPKATLINGKPGYIYKDRYHIESRPSFWPFWSVMSLTRPPFDSLEEAQDYLDKKLNPPTPTVVWESE
jgi:viroplasmin and RNaseH domain-containing protein